MGTAGAVEQRNERVRVSEAEYRRRAAERPDQRWELDCGWRRQPNGPYTESLHRDGTIQPHALPGVTIDIAALFDWE